MQIFLEIISELRHNGHMVGGIKHLSTFQNYDPFKNLSENIDMTLFYRIIYLH